MIIIKCFGLKCKVISKYINDSLLYVVQYMMYYQYMFLYNILSMKFRWVRLSPFSLSSKPCTRFRRLWCRDILGGRKRCRGCVSTEMHLKNLSSALCCKKFKWPRRLEEIHWRAAVAGLGLAKAISQVSQVSRTDRQNSWSRLDRTPLWCSVWWMPLFDLLHRRWRSPTRPVKRMSAWLWQMRGRSCADFSHSFHWIQGSEEHTASVRTTRVHLIRGLPWRSCLSLWHRESSGVGCESGGPD